jgi:hypothetical protein
MGLIMVYQRKFICREFKKYPDCEKFYGNQELFRQIDVNFAIAYQERRREGPYDVLAT